jgi:predicted nucleotidyltransferase
MDLGNPMTSVIPGAYGDVLAVLARTEVALSGRRVASLTRGPTSRRRVDAVLAELAHAGVVLVQEVPPAKLYRLNRDHVAAAGIEALASLRDTLLSRMRTELASWAEPPVAAWLFGSAARGEATADSDIDLLLIRPPLDSDDDTWDCQVDALRESVRAWSGNELEVLSLNVDELHQLRDRGERLIGDLLADTVVLAGSDVRRLVGRKSDASG